MLGAGRERRKGRGMVARGESGVWDMEGGREIKVERRERD